MSRYIGDMSTIESPTTHTYTVLSMGGRLLASGADYMVMRRRARELAECRGLYVEFHGPHMPVLYVYPGESS